MKRLCVLAFAAACGSASPKPTPPETGSAATATAPTGALLGLGEIAIQVGGKDAMRLHADGTVEFMDDKGTAQPVGKVSADGTFKTSDGQTGTLAADGTFTTPDGVAPFKVQGTALVGAHHDITIENGKLAGDPDLAAMSVTGANDDATKRTALLLIGIYLSAAAQGSSTGSAVGPAAH